MSRGLRRALVALLLWRLLGPAPTPSWPPGQRHPWRVPGRSVFIGDREMFVRETGPDDGPRVVLVHGLGGSSLAEWYEVGARLEERFRVVLVDLRNHGMTPRENSRFEVQDLADDLAAVMGVLGLAGADVVGYSMGGAIAQVLAHRHPHLVGRMALVASFTHHPTGWRVGRQVGVWLTRAWERLTGTGTPEVRAAYLIATGAVAEAHRRFMWEETHRRDPDAGAASSFALLRFDSRPWVARIAVPTLVVVPTSDQLVPASWQRRLAEALPQATLLEIPGARHELPWTHPGELARALTDFFDER